MPCKTLAEIEIIAVNRHDDSALECLMQSVATKKLVGDIRSMVFHRNDCVVSPGNTQGFMGGQSPNIDSAYRDMFGAQIQMRVQQLIRSMYDSHVMPFGKALILNTHNGKTPRGKPGHMIMSPTVIYQELDMPPRALPDVAGKAMKAVLTLAGECGVKRLFIPPMGMGSAVGVDNLISEFRQEFIDAYDHADLYLDSKYGHPLGD